MDDLVRKLRSQIGDDVREIYSHEALFCGAADRIEELQRENATARELIATLEGEQARADRLAAQLKEAVEALRNSADKKFIERCIIAGLKSTGHAHPAVKPWLSQYAMSIAKRAAGEMSVPARSTLARIAAHKEPKA